MRLIVIVALVAVLVNAMVAVLGVVQAVLDVWLAMDIVMHVHDVLDVLVYHAAFLVMKILAVLAV